MAHGVPMLPPPLLKARTLTGLAPSACVLISLLLRRRCSQPQTRGVRFPDNRQAWAAGMGGGWGGWMMCVSQVQALRSICGQEGGRWHPSEQRGMTC